MTLSDSVETAMLAWRAGDNERQSARPKYSLEDFGWTESTIEPFFAEYLERYPKARDA